MAGPLTIVPTRVFEARRVRDLVARVKARLDPRLDEPYFETIGEFDYMAKKQCVHNEAGALLDTVERKVFCKKCKRQIDPFDALVAYANAERRLVRTAQTIRDAEKRERERQQREKERRPFARRVVRRDPIRDERMKDEPVIGQRLTLECGHTRDVGPDNRFKRVTCGVCAGGDLP